MKSKSNISNYLCFIVGESPERAARFHASTIRRTKNFAMAIHIPVGIWLVTGFLIAHAVFKLSDALSAAIALGCAGMIYLVERLVISTPKVWFINIGRIAIGFVIALLGASSVDLVIFEREIQEQLLESKRISIVTKHDAQINEQMKLVAQKKEDWLSCKTQLIAKLTVHVEAKSVVLAPYTKNWQDKQIFYDKST